MDTLYDLTGKDPAYKRIDRRYMVWKARQIVEFQEPVYSESIKVFKVLPTGVTEMLSGTDWSLTSSCVDYQGISDAKIRAANNIPEQNFSSMLYNGITVITYNDDEGQYEISIEYQALRKDLTQLNDESVGPDYSPGLMRDVIQNLDFLLNVKNPVSAVTSDTIANLNCLDVDLSGMLPENYINEETHTVNVPSSVNIIAPINGSFYKHDLVLKLVSNNTTLVEYDPATGIGDYIVLGSNHGKTQAATHSSGVFDYIWLRTAIVGDIKVSYHAFGGEVSRIDVNVLRDAIIDINTLLRGSDLITTASLGSTPIIKDLNTRLAVLEEQFRHFPVDSFTMRIGPNDRWINIAQIAHGAWTDFGSVPTSANGEFRIEVPSKEYIADLDIRYNISSTGVLVVDTLRVSAPDYLLDSLSAFNYRIVPKFRLAYNKADMNQGVLLQMSIGATTPADVIVKVSDRTGSSSPWELTKYINETRPDVTTNAVLPNGFNWVAAGTGNSGVSSTILVYDEAYAIWLGALPMSYIDKLSYRAGNIDENVRVPLNGVPVRLSISGTDVNINQIRAVRFTVYDRYTRNMLIETSSQVRSVTNLEFSAIAMYFVEDLCSIRLELVQNSTTRAYTGTIFTETGSNSLVNDRFDLRQIEVLV